MSPNLEGFAPPKETAEWIGVDEETLKQWRAQNWGPGFWPTGDGSAAYHWNWIHDFCEQIFTDADYDRVAKLMGYENADAIPAMELSVEEEAECLKVGPWGCDHFGQINAETLHCNTCGKFCG